MSLRGSRKRMSSTKKSFELPVPVIPPKSTSLPLLPSLESMTVTDASRRGTGHGVASEHTVCSLAMLSDEPWKMPVTPS